MYLHNNLLDKSNFSIFKLKIPLEQSIQNPYFAPPYRIKYIPVLSNINYVLINVVSPALDIISSLVPL